MHDQHCSCDQPRCSVHSRLRSKQQRHRRAQVCGPHLGVLGDEPRGDNDLRHAVLLRPRVQLGVGPIVLDVHRVAVRGRGDHLSRDAAEVRLTGTTALQMPVLRTYTGLVATQQHNQGDDGVIGPMKRSCRAPCCRGHSPFTAIEDQLPCRQRIGPDIAADRQVIPRVAEQVSARQPSLSGVLWKPRLPYSILGAGAITGDHQDVSGVHELGVAAQHRARRRHQLRAPQLAVAHHEVRELLRLHARCARR